MRPSLGRAESGDARHSGSLDVHQPLLVRALKENIGGPSQAHGGLIEGWLPTRMNPTQSDGLIHLAPIHARQRSFLDGTNQVAVAQPVLSTDAA